jgi:hypothetical protein
MTTERLQSSVSTVLGKPDENSMKNPFFTT